LLIEDGLFVVCFIPLPLFRVLQLASMVSAYQVISFVQWWYAVPAISSGEVVHFHVPSEQTAVAFYIINNLQNHILFRAFNGGMLSFESGMLLKPPPGFKSHLGHACACARVYCASVLATAVGVRCKFWVNFGIISTPWLLQLSPRLAFTSLRACIHVDRKHTLKKCFVLGDRFTWGWLLIHFTRRFSMPIGAILERKLLYCFLISTLPFL
jgi:hypothetical protein